MFVHNGTILECDFPNGDFSVDLDARSVFHRSRSLFSATIENGGGSINNMSSVVSSRTCIPVRFVCNAAKAAVIGLTKSVAADFIGSGIRCNATCPGAVQSPSLKERIRAFGNYETVRERYSAHQPMGRLGTTDEVAASATFLGSVEAAFVNGVNLVIDGNCQLLDTCPDRKYLEKIINPSRRDGEDREELDQSSIADSAFSSGLTRCAADFLVSILARARETGTRIQDSLARSVKKVLRSEGLSGRSVSSVIFRPAS